LGVVAIHSGAAAGLADGGSLPAGRVFCRALGGLDGLLYRPRPADGLPLSQLRPARPLVVSAPVVDANLEGEGAWDGIFGRLYRHEKDLREQIARRDTEIAMLIAATQALTDGVVLLDRNNHIFSATPRPKRNWALVDPHRPRPADRSIWCASRSSSPICKPAISAKPLTLRLGSFARIACCPSTCHSLCRRPPPHADQGCDADRPPRPHAPRLSSPTFRTNCARR
jgi:hypothetical protein